MTAGIMTERRHARSLYSLILLALIAPCHPLRADTLADPFPWVTTAEGGRYFFKMVPAKNRVQEDKIITEREAFGVAYSMAEDGSFEELWKTSGWFTFGGFLSQDGRYFVRMGPWASDQENLTDLAVAFYDGGKPLKEYAVRDLIRDTKAVVKSVSHYDWTPAKQTTPNGIHGGLFTLTLIDRTVCHFDLATGRLFLKETDPEARSEQEILLAQDRLASEQGVAMLRASPWREAWESVFSFSNIFNGRKFSDVWYEDPGWSADLTPSHPFGIPCLVEACFPVSKEGKIEVSLKPEEVIDAFRTALAHPYIVDSIKSKPATGIRLRITGDRPHWNTSQISEWCERASGNTMPAGELREWAYFILDASDRSYESFYMNTRSREILYGDDESWPRELIHLDAEGENIPLKESAEPTTPQSKDR